MYGWDFGWDSNTVLRGLRFGDILWFINCPALCTAAIEICMNGEGQFINYFNPNLYLTVYEIIVCMCLLKFIAFIFRTRWEKKRKKNANRMNKQIALAIDFLLLAHIVVKRVYSFWPENYIIRLSASVMSLQFLLTHNGYFLFIVPVWVKLRLNH